MGISLPIAKLLMEVGAAAPFAGRVLQLGRQNLYFDDDALGRAADALGYRLTQVPAEATVANPFLPGSPLMMSDGYFFRRLGFEQVDSLDASDFEGASVIFDLNEAETPADLRGRFDLVLDSGTLEHVFHLPNALRHGVEMLKPGGMVVHVSPSHNYLNHGFYCFSPTLFEDYYGSNGFELLTSQLFRFDPNADVNRGERLLLSAPRADFSRLFEAGSLDNRCYSIFFAARRKDASAQAVVPQQSSYVRAWSDGGGAGKPEVRKPALRKLLKKLARKHAALRRPCLALERSVAWRSLPWEPM